MSNTDEEKSFFSAISINKVESSGYIELHLRFFVLVIRLGKIFEARRSIPNGVSYIIQKGGAAVFTPEGQREIHQNIQLYKQNAKMLMQTLDALNVWYCGGKNAPYIWMKCPDGLGSWDFFDLLLNRIQVIGTPGEGFGACGEGYFRFSTFGSPADTQEAAKRLYELLK